MNEQKKEKKEKGKENAHEGQLIVQLAAMGSGRDNIILHDTHLVT
jgi:hypothetical protein